MRRIFLSLAFLLAMTPAWGQTILKQSTSVDVRIGPFVDVGDGFTPETAVTLTGGGDNADEAEALKYNGAATVDISAATWAAVTGADGWYDLTLTASHTDTVGDLTIVIQNDSVHLPVFARFQVVEETTYDSLYGSGAAAFDANDDVTVSGFTAGAIDATAIAADAIGASEIAADAITSSELATTAADEIRDLIITADQQIDVTATGEVGVDFSNINGTLDAAEIGADAITAAKIADAAIDDATYAADTDTYQAHLSYESTSTTTEFQLWWTDNGVHATGLSAASVDAWCFTNDGSATDVIGTSAAPQAFSEASTYDTFYHSDTYDLVDGTNYMCRLRATIDAATRTWYAPLDRTIGIRSVSQLDEAGGTGDHLTAIPWNAAWDAEVATELTDIGLDHLVGASVAGADVTDNSIIAKMVSSGATADWDTFVNTTEALQAIRDRGDAAWTTGSGTGLTALASGTAQGGSANTIQLAAGETFADSEPNGNIISITGGTGVGQSRVITSYVGATDTATVARSWTTNPDATSTYEMIGGSMNVDALSVDGTAAQNMESDYDGTGYDKSNSTIGTVSAVGNNGITASSIAANAITAAEVADDAIGAAEAGFLLDSTGFNGADVGTGGGAGIPVTAP